MVNSIIFAWFKAIMKMTEVEALILNINKYAKSLVEAKGILQDENKKLREKNSQLETLVEQKTKEIKGLKEKNEVIRIAKTLESGEKSTDAKKKINELVREIDKCITLLNR